MLATEIRRQSQRAENRGFLCNLPMFKLDNSLPPSMWALLDRLDHAEQRLGTPAGSGRH